MPPVGEDNIESPVNERMHIYETPGKEVFGRDIRTKPPKLLQETSSVLYPSVTPVRYDTHLEHTPRTVFHRNVAVYKMLV